MKKKKNLGEQQSNLTLVFFFCLFIGLLIIGSILFKAIFLVMQSKYDAVHRFTISVVNPDTQTNKKLLSIYSFSPDTNTITILRLDGKTLIDGSSLGKYLGIPIDAEIVFKDPEGKSAAIERLVADDQSMPDGLMGRAFFNFYDLKTKLTQIDILRLFLFAKSTPTHAITEKKLVLDAKGRLPDDITIDKIVAPLFIDAALADEKMSIQIINGTETAGLANRLARILINMGGNVVAVSTSDSIFPRSAIEYVGEKSYTVDRLSKTFGLTAREVQKSGISDIIIKLGKDNINPKAF